MPSVVLTDIVARKAKSIEGSQYTLWDASLRGFGLRIGGSVRTWTVMVGKERRRICIGHYPAMGLQAARKEAKRLLLAAAVARNQGATINITFAAAVDNFVEVGLHKVRQGTGKEYERILRKHFEPVWKARLLTEITRNDINRVLDQLVADTPATANQAFKVIRLFLRWARRRGYLANTPSEGLQMPAKRLPRDRVLSKEELQRVLKGAQTLDTLGTIIALLVLTGQRRGEIANLRSTWIDRSAAVIRFPREFTKNGQEHVLPATPLVLELMPARDGLLFPARGHPDRAFNGWSKSFDEFREICAVDDFTLHDLRRTAATMMAELGILPHIIERILNHITGSTAQSITTLGRIYNRHLYLDEMRDALTRWEAAVVSLRT